MNRLIHSLPLLAAALTAHAQFVSGNDLLSSLTSTNQVTRTGAVGYVVGVHDTTRGVVQCSPQTVTIGQITDMAVAMLNGVPEYRDKPADVLLTLMFQSTWPCAKKSTTERPS